LTTSKKYKNHDSTVHYRNGTFWIHRVCIAQAGKILIGEKGKREYQFFLPLTSHPKNNNK